MALVWLKYGTQNLSWNTGLYEVKGHAVQVSGGGKELWVYEAGEIA